MPQQRFCPNCGSTNVEPDTTNAASIAAQGGNLNKWKCNECKFTGMMPEGEPEEDMKFEPGEEYSREDTGFGRAYLKYLVYIALPFTVLYLYYRLLL